MYCRFCLELVLVYYFCFFYILRFLYIILLFYKNNNYFAPDQKTNYFLNRPFSLFIIFIRKTKNMQNVESVWAVVVTLITVLGSTAAWRFYEKRAIQREKDEDFIRHDCRDRIGKLEALLISSSQEKDNMRQTILELTEKVAQLTVKVEYLQKEIVELMNAMIKK